MIKEHINSFLFDKTKCTIKQKKKCFFEWVGIRAANR